MATNHDDAFDNAVKEMKKLKAPQKPPNDPKQRQATDDIVRIYGVNPCGPGERWDSTAQACVPSS
jgi:hypothetical protein